MNSFIQNQLKQKLKLIHLNSQQKIRLVSFKNIFGQGGNKDKNKNEFEEDNLTSETRTIAKPFTPSGGDPFAKYKPKSVTRLIRKKSYKPREESFIENEIKQMYEIIYSNKYNENVELNDSFKKYKLLTNCIEKFKHDIPNTQLNDIQRVKDLVDYFKLEQKDTNALEELAQRNDLPSNLHINTEYNRFNPKLDTFFNGLDAYPNRSTFVTSLWYSRKYKAIDKKKELFMK